MRRAGPRAAAGPGHPGAGRGGPAGRARLIVLALCAPLLLPGLHPSKLFSSGPGIGGNGGGGVGLSLSLPSALAETVTQLHESRPSTVFTYTTTASPTQQSNDAQYFRQYVFDTLADEGWQVDDYPAHAVPIGQIPDPQGLTDATSAQTRDDDGHASARTSPAQARSRRSCRCPIRPSTSARRDSGWPTRTSWCTPPATPSPAGPTRWPATRWTPARRSWSRCPGLARTAGLAADLQLPSSYRTPALKKLADSYTAGQTTEFGKVDALANWLSGGQFSYNLTAAPLSSAASLLNFLTKTKSGFCVQYAYAMTVLTRLLGIPARFVVGYTAGTRLKNGSYVVRNTDAHAWTEVYFPTFGWIRFEPTPAGQGTAYPPNYMTSGTGRGRSARPPRSSRRPSGRVQVHNPNNSGLNHLRPQSGSVGRWRVRRAAGPGRRGPRSHWP